MLSWYNENLKSITPFPPLYPTPDIKHESKWEYKATEIFTRPYHRIQQGYESSFILSWKLDKETR